MSNIVVGIRESRRNVSGDLIVRRLGKFLKAREVRREFPLVGEPDLYVQWGFRLTPGLKDAIAHHVPFAIIDLGLFGDRDTCISVSFNGFHGLSMIVQDLPKTERRHPPLLPFALNIDGPSVILGQLDGDRALRGVDAGAWATRTAQKLADRGEQVLIRPHPKMLNRGERNPSLQTLREGAYRTIAWTSTAAIESARLGIPTTTLHPANLAWPVSAHDLDALVLPDESARREWMHRLSYMNYSAEEFGAAAKYIRDRLPQAGVAATQGEYDTMGIAP